MIYALIELQMALSPNQGAGEAELIVWRLVRINNVQQPYLHGSRREIIRSNVELPTVSFAFIVQAQI